MKRIFFFLLGFGFMVIGCTYFVIYLNFFTVGFTIQDYLVYTLTRPECIMAIIGFILITITIFLKGEDKVDLHI